MTVSLYEFLKETLKYIESKNLLEFVEQTTEDDNEIELTDIATVINAVCKYIPEDKIENYLDSLDLDLCEDLEIEKILEEDTILPDSIMINLIDDYDTEYLIELCQEYTINQLSENVQNYIKDKIIDYCEENNDDTSIIYDVLTKLVEWYDDPFEIGYCDFEKDPIKYSLLDKDTIIKLFKIYARNNNWRENDAVRIFAKNSTCLRKQADELRNMSLSYMLHTYNWNLDDEDENDESLSEKLKRWGYNIEEDPVISIDDIADLLWKYNYGWY